MRFVFFWSLLACQLSPAAPYRPVGEVLPARDFELGLGWTQSISHGNYDENDDLNEFIGDAGYERYDYQGAIRYGLFDRLELSWGGSYRFNFSWNQNGRRSDGKGI